MLNSPLALFGVFSAAVGGLYLLLYRWRFQQYTYIPSVLKSNLLFGHIGYLAAGFKKIGNAGVHADHVFEDIWKEHGRPEYMLFDVRPMQKWPLLLICSHEMAEQVSRPGRSYPYSVTKSPTVKELSKLIGEHSMISEEGEAWKSLRKRFNPGFAPQHLLSRLPIVIEKTRLFMNILDDLARSGKVTELETPCVNVTFDIISEVITGVDAKTQTGGGGLGAEIIDTFRDLNETYDRQDGNFLDFLNASKHVKRHFSSKRLDKAVKKCVTDKYAEIVAARGTGKDTVTDKSVLALALKDIDTLTPQDLQYIADQLKSFLFAGHDTTAILLQWLFYKLSTHPSCLAKIRAEHDSIFGINDPEQVFLARPDETIKALVYTSACIKEALRLWSPASTARMSQGGFTVRSSDGAEVCIDNTVLYLIHHIIHRDPKVYGETADEFVPDRWVGNADTSSEGAGADVPATSAGGGNKIPISAWRPFERGPRNCIGQELANLEARVILACVMRRYDFVKVGDGEVQLDEKEKPVVDEKGNYKVKNVLFKRNAITSKPVDRMVMRVKFHEKV